MLFLLEIGDLHALALTEEISSRGQPYNKLS